MRCFVAVEHLPALRARGGRESGVIGAMSGVAGCGGQPSAARRDYRIAEYVALTGKIDRSARDLHIAEVTFATGIGLFYAWVFKDGLSIASAGRWILAVPVFLAILATTRISARFAYIGKIATYLSIVEKEMFGDDDAAGWERHYAARPSLYPAFRIGTWALATIASVMVLFFVPLPDDALSGAAGELSSGVSRRIR